MTKATQEHSKNISFPQPKYQKEHNNLYINSNTATQQQNKNKGYTAMLKQITTTQYMLLQNKRYKTTT